MGWNDREIAHSFLSRVMAKTANPKKAKEVKVRLHADMAAFLDGGGTIEYLPSCQCTISAATNKPFRTSQRKAK